MNCPFKQQTTIFIQIFSPPCRAINSCTSQLSSLSRFSLPALPSCLVSTSVFVHKLSYSLFSFFLLSFFNLVFSQCNQPQRVRRLLRQCFPIFTLHPIFIYSVFPFPHFIPCPTSHSSSQPTSHPISHPIFNSSAFIGHQIRLHICGTYACKRYIYSCRQVHGLDVRRNAKQNAERLPFSSSESVWRGALDA